MEDQNAPLFTGKSDNTWPLNACLNFLDDMTFGYVEGYRKAGDILATRILETNDSKGEIDYLIYPIVFLFHHHMELRLKDLIKLSALFLAEEEHATHHHNLSKLWETAKSLLQKIYGNPEEFIMADKVVEELYDIDKNAEAFRYPLSKGGQKNLTSKCHVNLVTFAKKINEVNDFLANLDQDLSVKLEQGSLSQEQLE